ncbi:DUF2490 domain-containing protein [Mucilaginibacter gynuensis]|uniref:DUF2490 domain-containing protein n=1 Tax=Mucilaginibacter gynuensis TaxID=1302236 RepID=UPI0031E5A48D
MEKLTKILSRIPLHGNIAVILIGSYFSGYAQQAETQGWLFLTHTQKLNQNFDILFDAQTRSADKFDYANTLLLRTALNYNFNSAHSFALGYAYKKDRERIGGIYDYTNENRTYEQYLYTFRISKTEMIVRGRLEQRWVKNESKNFSQRARIFISGQIPIFTDTGFSNGMYAGVQNEIFLNVTNKKNVNKRFFDQNRTFLSLGYRWSKEVDTEIGYMYWYKPESEDTFRRNVIQLQVTTSF